MKMIDCVLLHVSHSDTDKGWQAISAAFFESRENDGLSWAHMW